MLTTFVVINAMKALLAELKTRCRLISLAGLEMDEFFLEDFDQELVDRLVIMTQVSFDAPIRRM